jgi:protein-disulfide isomerase
MEPDTSSPPTKRPIIRHYPLSLNKSSSHGHHQLLCVSQEGTFMRFFSMSTTCKHHMTSAALTIKGVKLKLSL